ncbi:MAG: ATP-binding protein [Planctomycetes bacterium]|nr:ATP-binding protein [Planctomycetota bacterium]
MLDESEHPSTAELQLAQKEVLGARADALLRERGHAIACRTDRMFAGLLLLEWAAALLAALLLTPLTWEGRESSTHVHVWSALVGGGLITALPVFLVWSAPGAVMNRYVIAIAQMAYSGLLIQVAGGRIETHFHVFGSLAFLAFYRDWRVLIPATIVVAFDHLARGYFWPESVYGVMAASPWRSAEHAAWVLFENVFLVQSCLRGTQEMRVLALQHAQLELTNERVEAEVAARSRELEITHRQLLDSSRRAGMAEVATGVLHNAGNALNSVNVSANVLSDIVRGSKIGGVRRVAELFEQNAGDLAGFLANDERGKQAPKYLCALAATLEDERRRAQEELTSLAKSVDHIKAIVGTQQALARVPGVSEVVPVADIIDDALRMGIGPASANGIHVERHCDVAAPVIIDRQRVVQILVNLLRNAKAAIAESATKEGRISIRSELVDKDRLQVEVSDTGVGIPKENLTRIFAFGFTTRKDGNGFGLHSSALAAKEMGGTLSATSAGPGRGSCFTLQVPVALQEVSV